MKYNLANNEPLEINGDVYYEAPLSEFAQLFGQFMDFGYNIPVESSIYFEEIL